MEKFLVFASDNIQVRYTNDEKVVVILIFGECGKNAITATTLYARRNPARQYPFNKIFRDFEKTIAQNWLKETRN